MLVLSRHRARTRWLLVLLLTLRAVAAHADEPGPSGASPTAPAAAHGPSDAAAPTRAGPTQAEPEGPAEAQDVEPPEYRTTIREALAEYRARHFLEARALFAEAHRLLPNARTLRGLGMTAFELRSYRESIGFLQQALAHEVKPLEGGLRNETERLLKRAERFVAKLELTTEPPDVRVTLDGAPVERPEGEPLLLDIGPHELEFSAEGYVPETRSIEVKRHKRESWTITLEPLPTPEVAAIPTAAETARASELAARPTRARESDDDTKSARSLRKNPWLWSGVGAAVVTVVLTSVLLAKRDPGLGPVRESDKTPPMGIFTALESAP